MVLVGYRTRAAVTSPRFSNLHCISRRRLNRLFPAALDRFAHSNGDLDDWQRSRPELRNVTAMGISSRE